MADFDLPDLFKIPKTVKNDVKISTPIDGTDFSFIPADGGIIVHPFSKSLKIYLNDGASEEKKGSPVPTAGGAAPAAAPKKEPSAYDKFISQIPVVSIREFSISDRINYISNWASWIKEGFDSAIKVSSAKDFFSNVTAQFNKFTNALGAVFSEEGIKALITSISDAVKSVPDAFGIDINMFGKHKDSLCIVPFALYYGFTSSATTGTYKLPFNISEDFLDSDGTYGWGGDNASGVIQSLIGNKFLKDVLTKFRVQSAVTPSWMPSGNAPCKSIKVTFDLINDSIDAAKANSSFVYTIIGKNRWVQWGIVQSSASLYDIRLPSGMRYFMCSGQISCAAKGTLRKVPGIVIGGRDDILIPDIYSITITFKSLLPDNFNGFLWSFASKSQLEITNVKSVQTEFAKTVIPAIKNVERQQALEQSDVVNEHEAEVKRLQDQQQELEQGKEGLEAEAAECQKIQDTSAVELEKEGIAAHVEAEADVNRATQECETAQAAANKADEQLDAAKDKQAAVEKEIKEARKNGYKPEQMDALDKKLNNAKIDVAVADTAAENSQKSLQEAQQSLKSAQQVEKSVSKKYPYQDGTKQHIDTVAVKDNAKSEQKKIIKKIDKQNDKIAKVDKKISHEQKRIAQIKEHIEKAKSEAPVSQVSTPETKQSATTASS